MIISNFDFEANDRLAEKKAKEMIRNGLYSRFSLQEAQRLEKARIGCLGELAFAHFLDQHHCAYTLDKTDFSKERKDEFDFLVQDWKIDVKVAKKSTANSPSDKWTYGYPVEQNPHLKNAVAIGWVDHVKKEAGFYGWIRGAEIAKQPVVTQNSFRGYAYRTPNYEFTWGMLNKDFKALFQQIAASSSFPGERSHDGEMV